MLKRFFISMLGTVAGVFISGMLAVGVLIAIVGAVAGKSLATDAGIKKHSILHLKLDGALTERMQMPSLMEIIQGDDEESVALDEVCEALRLAADDKNIDGVFIDCGAFSGGVAGCEEIVNALRRFRSDCDKWVCAYADSYTQGAYVIASQADSVFVNPIGGVDVHGTASVTPFFKELLDKVGVSMQIIKVGTYKSAVEPFILNEMSEPARRQSQEYVDSIWHYISGAVAEGRAVKRDTVQAWADSMCAIWPAARTISEGLADAAVYRRVMEQRLRELTELDDDEDLRLVSPSAYIEEKGGVLKAMDAEKDHVAVYYAVGDIVDSGSEGIVGETVVKDIVELADDDKVKGLLLRVNSGGGSAFASEQIWEALEYFKSKDKPFYVSMGDYAASGGYYISCGAQRIFADATTLTGSIGVFGMIPEASTLLGDKLGVHFSFVESNPNAAFPTVVRPLTPEQHAAMQQGVNDTYKLFTGRVAEGRDLPVDSVLRIAEGRVWVGTSALRLGLVDEIADLHEAVKQITAASDLDEDFVVMYPKSDEDMWATILHQSKAVDAARAAAGLSPMERRAMRVVERLMGQNPVQARMPLTVIK
ncbi:signal peptide peptidase SppA [Muribaculum intestinale]|uniref:signal peptide peptidase SppA n=1 Tax=Muribaculum intestinale TaxID=1796646 RepID=UPI00262C02D2|nr:signal peptide peptidase SppA [Muribaculum intestinale]